MKKILLSAAISFVLNVGYTGILATLYFFDVFHGKKKDSWSELPFYFSIWFIKTAFPQIKGTYIPSISFRIFIVFVLYFVNTLIYTFPIYGIWWFIRQNKKPKPVLSEEPPPPPEF